MATLTETAYYTRKAIKWGIIGLISLLVLRVIFDFTVDTWRRLHPPPPPPPTVAFGRLPAIKFPSQSSPSAKFNFTLETIEGKPYLATSSATVFFMPKPAANLLSLIRAKQFAGRLGFQEEPETNNQTRYLWRDKQNPLRTLDYDIVNNNFELSYDYPADLSLFAEKNLPSSENAIITAKKFLQDLNINISLLDNGETKVSFWQLNGNTLVKTTSLANADAVRVDLGRENLTGMKLLSPHYPDELIYFVFSGSSQSSKKILKASYKFWPVETEEKATYPLKTAVSAFTELKNNQGFIVRMGSTNEVTIRKISLAYFYSQDYQEFLQPIFVFEGDPDFMAFVPALDPNWVGK